MQARGGGCEISVGAPALSFFQSLPHRSASPTRCHRGVTRASSGRACGSVRVLCPRARTVVTAHQYAVQGTWGAQCRIRSCSGVEGVHEKARTEGKGKRSCPTHKKRHAPIESRLRNIIASFIFLVEADQSASAGACATAAVRLMSAGRADESGGGIHVPGSPSHSGQLFPPHYTRLSHAQMTFISEVPRLPSHADGLHGAPWRLVPTRCHFL